MAKKKKKAGLAAKPLATTQGDASTFFLWFAAVGGALLLLVALAVPWVTVLASAKNGASLLSDSFGKDKTVFAGLVFLLLPGLSALALPFLPPSQQLREGVATLTSVLAFTSGIIVSVFAWSTRNILALGAGRQAAEPGLLFISIAFIFGGSLGYLILRDSADNKEQSSGLAWYGVFVAVLVVVLYVNYAVIPDSIIPPPDYIRQRLGWMD